MSCQLGERFIHQETGSNVDMSKHIGSAELLAQQETASFPDEAPANSLLQWRSIVRSARGIQDAAQIVANFARGSVCAGDDSPSNHDCRGNTCAKTEEN